MATFTEVLLANPYDKFTRFEISPEEFMEHIHHVSDEYAELGKEFIDQFSVKDGNKIFFFLTGFPGVGKTTFINWLISQIKTNNNQYFKANTSNILTEYINLSFETTSKSNYFEASISSVIKKRFNTYKDAFKFILDNRTKFEKEFSEFIGKKKIITKLVQLDQGNPDDEDELIDNWNSFIENLSSHSLILLCLLEKTLKINSDTERYCFFCVDNLDALSYDYLISGFWSDYFKSFGDVLYISEKMNWPSVRYRFKIVFILRQYNYNLIRENINPHAISVMDPFIYNNKYFIQKNIKKILEKRKQYALNKKIDINKSTISLIDVILSEDSIYRDKVYLPLFNYDIRKINQKIVEISTTTNIIDFTFDKDEYNKLYYSNKTDKHPHRNGARGIIIHSFIKALFASEEKYPIDPIFDDDGSNGSQPFCSYCRMLMTVMFNLSYASHKRLDKDLSKIDSIKPDSFSLDRLIINLRIFENKNTVIPYENIFDWLKKFYSLKNKVFTHLIELSNKNESNLNDSPKNPLGSILNFENEFQIAKNTDSTNLSSTILREIKIRINPSGVIYLRYLVTHFEFMSSYTYWRNEEYTNKFKPLFLSIAFNKNNRQYEFEKLLIDVLSVVIRKKQGNDSFLKQKIFVGDSKLKTITDYLNSILTIHFDQSPNQLYSSRMIATHLSYIESFRNYLNTNELMVSRIVKNHKDYKGKSLDEINVFILKDIELMYINLCINTSIYLIDESVYSIMKKWNEKINELLINKNFNSQIDIGNEY